MPTQPEKRVRPAGDGTNGASELDNGEATSSLPRIPAPADVLADLDALAEHLRAHLVLQVTVDDNGHRRTAVYRSAAAVERAVRRAQERGRQAHVTLCQLLPVGVVSSLTTAPPASVLPRPCVWCGSPTTSTDAEPMHAICATAHATRGGAA